MGSGSRGAWWDFIGSGDALVAMSALARTARKQTSAHAPVLLLPYPSPLLSLLGPSISRRVRSRIEVNRLLLKVQAQNMKNPSV